MSLNNKTYTFYLKGVLPAEVHCHLIFMNGYIFVKQIIYVSKCYVFMPGKKIVVLG